MIRRAAMGSPAVSRGDFAARVGGDDFGVILPGGDLDFAAGSRADRS
jgi:GGDEF domain-containing protein